MGSGMKQKVMAITALMGVFAGLVLAAGTATSAEPAPKCAGDKEATKVTVGIAEMLGCWTDVPLDGTGWYNSSERAARIFGDLPAPGHRYQIAEWSQNVFAGDEEAAKATANELGVMIVKGNVGEFADCSRAAAAALRSTSTSGKGAAWSSTRISSATAAVASRGST